MPRWVWQAISALAGNVSAMAIRIDQQMQALQFALQQVFDFVNDEDAQWDVATWDSGNWPSLPMAVQRTGDTMTGELKIFADAMVGPKLLIGQVTLPAGFGIGGAFTMSGDFRGTSKDLMVVYGKLNSASGATGLPLNTDITVTGNSHINQGCFFGASVVDNSGGFTGYKYYSIVAGGDPFITYGAIDTIVGVLVPDVSVATHNYAIKTGKGAVDLGDNVNVASGKVYKVNGTQVVAAQQAAIADAAGGAVIDAEARAALNTLLSELRTHGLIAT